jgi:hypothetical protein
MARLTTYLDLESLKIRWSGFNFKLNLTSAIGDVANCNILASYVSCFNAMAYDRHDAQNQDTKPSLRTWIELSPQHWVQEAKDNYPRTKDTRMDQKDEY